MIVHTHAIFHAHSIMMRLGAALQVRTICAPSPLIRSAFNERRNRRGCAPASAQATQNFRTGSAVTVLNNPSRPELPPPMGLAGLRRMQRAREPVDGGRRTALLSDHDCLSETTAAGFTLWKGGSLEDHQDSSRGALRPQCGQVTRFFGPLSSTPTWAVMGLGRAPGTYLVLGVPGVTLFARLGTPSHSHSQGERGR